MCGNPLAGPEVPKQTAIKTFQKSKEPTRSERKKKGRGRRGTILTGSGGIEDTAVAGKKTQLGA